MCGINGLFWCVWSHVLLFSTGSSAEALVSLKGTWIRALISLFDCSKMTLLLWTWEPPMWEIRPETLTADICFQTLWTRFQGLKVKSCFELSDPEYCFTEILTITCRDSFHRRQSVQHSKWKEQLPEGSQYQGTAVLPHHGHGQLDIESF